MKCVECGKDTDTNIWQPGWGIVAGQLCICGPKCGEKYAKKNAGFLAGRTDMEFAVQCPNCFTILFTPKVNEVPEHECRPNESQDYGDA